MGTGTGSVISNANTTTNVSAATTNIVTPIPYATTTQTPAGTNWIAIGTGATQEIVQTATIINPKIQTTTNATVITLMTPLKYPHWPGESVSNVVPGNPGPQTGFNYSQAPFSYAAPFVVRLQ